MVTHGISMSELDIAQPGRFLPIFGVLELVFFVLFTTYHFPNELHSLLGIGIPLLCLLLDYCLVCFWLGVVIPITSSFLALDISREAQLTNFVP